MVGSRGNPFAFAEPLWYVLGLCWESQLGYHPYTSVGIPSPDIAGQHLLLVLAEPGVPGLAALTLPDEAIMVLVQGQEGCPCPLPLLGCQQPQKGILGVREVRVEHSPCGNLPLYIPRARGPDPECHGQECWPWESAPGATASGVSCRSHLWVP